MNLFQKKYSNHLIIILIVLKAATLYFFTLSNDHVWATDFGGYLLQARSLIESNPTSFIEENRFIIEESNRPAGPIAYPWGYPVLLSLQMKLFGDNILGLKSVNTLLYLCFIALLWYGMKDYLTTIPRVILVSLFAFNAEMIAYLNAIVSDISYLFFSTALIFFMGRVIIQQRYSINARIDLFLLGTGIAICFFIRSNGLLFLPTLLLSQILSISSNKITINKKSLLKSSIPYLAFLFAVIFWRFLLPGGGSGHLKVLSDINYNTSILYLNYYINLPSQFFSAAIHEKIFFGLSFSFFLIGLFERVHRDYHIIIYCLITMALYVMWPATLQGIRFIFPVLPFYFYFVFTGLASLKSINRISFNYLYSLVLILFSILLLVQIKDGVKNAISNIQRERKIHSYGPYTEEAKEVFSYITNKTSKSDIIIFRKPRAMSYYTRRSSISENSGLALTKGDYICLDLGDYRDQLPPEDINELLKAGTIELVLKNTGYEIYKIRKEYSEKI